MSKRNQNQSRKNGKSQQQNNEPSSILNKTFIINERKERNENRRKYPSLTEAALKIPKIQLDRSSSPNSFNFCDHCSHNHNQKCCMYVHDDFSDISRYSSFKSEVDEPYWTLNTSEDFDFNIGNTTPKFFPRKNS
jgi:hypothetical protein